MGNAEGQGSITAAVGHVTGLNQSITASDEGGSVSTETLHGMIQTNADIVPGDSGGPLASGPAFRARRMQNDDTGLPARARAAR